MEFSIATKTVTAEYRNDWPEMGQYRVFCWRFVLCGSDVGESDEFSGQRFVVSVPTRERRGLIAIQRLASSDGVISSCGSGKRRIDISSIVGGVKTRA